MARPRKKTLDFFMHDANARSDRKVKGLRRKHGNDGYATYFVLLEMICQEEGMKLTLTDSLDVETTIEETGVRDEAHLYQILQTCVDLGLFDKQLWESERIVFSRGLHSRYVGRLEEREAAADRQRRSREAKALRKRIEELDQQENKKSAEEKQDPDPDPETRSRNQISDPRSQIQSITRDVLVTTPLSHVTNHEETGVLESQFTVKPYRAVDGAIDPDFCLWVGKQMPRSKESDMHPKTKGRNHIINCEKAGSVEKLMGYWTDYLSAEKEQSQIVKPISVTPGEYQVFEDAS